MDSSGGYTENAFLAEFYDHVVPHQSRSDVAFFVDMAQRYGGPVLELGCGTGRVLIPTARAGTEIVGLDASPLMLTVCRNKVLKEPEAVQAKVSDLIQGDIREFDLGRKFNLVSIPFRPFQHLLTVNDQLSCLRSIHRHLSDTGRLILDVFNPSLPHLSSEISPIETDEGEFTMPDGRIIRRRVRIVGRDYFAQTIDSEMIYDVAHPTGAEERLVHRFQFRYLFRYEIEHLLARCGFELEEIYADYDKSPYGSKYPGELIAVARRM